MSEKPLNVQVAEALGWPPADRAPDYDTDWSATGPLIEQFGIALTPPSVIPTKKWAATSIAHGHMDCVGADLTPLGAVCRLILRLKDAGKL